MSNEINPPAFKPPVGRHHRLHIRTVSGMTEQGVTGAEIEETAQCPSDTLALGGGYKIHNGKDKDGHYKEDKPPNSIVIEINRPYFDPNGDGQTPLGWKVAGRVIEGTGTAWNLDARVICADLEILW
jgi:hypothetical protein